MAQLSDDCFAFGGALLPLEEAQARIAALHAAVAGIETVTLANASGRILGGDLLAPIDLPPWPISAVDGYAIHHADLNADAPPVLPIAGRIAAGGATVAAPRGYAVRIFTGAVMPEGPDTVMMQEDCAVTPEGVRFAPG